jgi:hypothetical protein
MNTGWRAAHVCRSLCCLVRGGAGAAPVQSRLCWVAAPDGLVHFWCPDCEPGSRPCPRGSSPHTVSTRCLCACRRCQICYPKPTDKPLYNGLVTQVGVDHEPCSFHELCGALLFGRAACVCVCECVRGGNRVLTPVCGLIWPDVVLRRLDKQQAGGGDKNTVMYQSASTCNIRLRTHARAHTLTCACSHACKLARALVRAPPRPLEPQCKSLGIPFVSADDLTGGAPLQERFDGGFGPQTGRAPFPHPHPLFTQHPPSPACFLICGFASVPPRRPACLPTPPRIRPM